MFGKKLIGKIASAMIAGMMVLGCGATVFAAEKTVKVDERYIYHRQCAAVKQYEFIPETTGEYIFQSVCEFAGGGFYVNPNVTVEQGDNMWMDFNSADGINFMLRVHLEGGVPCVVTTQCDGRFVETYLYVEIKRVDVYEDPEEDVKASEVPELTEEQIYIAKLYVRGIMLLAYSEDEDITVEDIDNALENITVEELVAICEEFDYTFWKDAQ